MGMFLSGMKKRDMEVHDRALEIYTNEERLPRFIWEKLVLEFGEDRVPTKAAIYNWRMNWEADERRQGRKVIRCYVKKKPSKTAHTRSELPLVCRRDGLPYILQENCVAWQKRWRNGRKKNGDAAIYLRACQDCENWVKEE